MLTQKHERNDSTDGFQPLTIVYSTSIIETLLQQNNYYCEKNDRFSSYHVPPNTALSVQRKIYDLRPDSSSRIED